MSSPLPLVKFVILSSLLCAAGGGCAARPPEGEDGILRDVTQLTAHFERAGEAYFSPKMDWIVFQATPHGEMNYQMYVAPLKLNPAPFLGTPIRVSPN